MGGIKIPLQDFALKMQGNLCVRGGVFMGHHGICMDISIHLHFFPPVHVRFTTCAQ